MKILIITAMNQDRVIGKDGQLPWHLPEDLKFFKRQTAGTAVVMGRKTYESMGRPLPRRRNLIITRQIDYEPAMPTRPAPDDPALEVLFAPEDGDARRTDDQTCVDVFNDIERALECCRHRNEPRAFIIGGAQIYEQALKQDLIDEMLITHVDQPGIEGDAYFPAFDESKWRDDGPVDDSFVLARRYVRIC